MWVAFRRVVLDKGEGMLARPQKGVRSLERFGLDGHRESAAASAARIASPTRTMSGRLSPSAMSSVGEGPA